MSNSLFSLAFGVGTQNRQGTWLEVFYAQPLTNPSAALVDAIAPVLNYTGGNQAITFSNTQASQLAEALKHVDPAQAALLTRLAESHKPLVATLLAEDAATGAFVFGDDELAVRRNLDDREADVRHVGNFLPFVLAIAARNLSTTFDNVAGDGSGGDAVPVVKRPTKLVHKRSKRQARVRKASADDDVRTFI